MTMTDDRPFVPALATAVLLSDVAAHLAQYPQLAVLSIGPATHPSPIDQHRILIAGARGEYQYLSADSWKAAASDWVDTLGVDVLTVEVYPGGQVYLQFVAGFGSSSAKFTCRAPWLDGTGIREGAVVDAADLR